MTRCVQCGAPTEEGRRMCARCEADVVRAAGEVIPPDGVTGDEPVQRPSARAGDSFRKALAIAVVADALQLLFFPLFAPGALSPAADVLDFLVCWLLVRTIGWHWAFVPSLIAEVIPGLDELPSWTLAVLYVRAEHRLRSSTSH